MNLFRIRYTKYFLTGTMQNLTHVDEIMYPESSRDRVIKEIERNIKTRRVIQGIGGSAYYITHYELVKKDDNSNR